MVIDSFKQKQRNILLELVDNNEDILITEVSDVMDTNDINLKINFNLITDKEKFINDFELFVKECYGI